MDQVQDRDINRLIRICDRAAREENWRKVIKFTDPKQSPATDRKLILLRIIAAKALDRPKIALAAADLIASRVYSFQEIAPIFRALASETTAVAAWKILTSPNLKLEDHQLLKQAGRVYAATSDAKLRTRIARVIKRARNGGAKVKPSLSSIEFPYHEKNVEFEYSNNVTIYPSSRVDGKHITRLSHEVDRCVEKLSSGTAPHVVEYRNVFVDRYGQIWDQSGAVILSKGFPIPDMAVEPAPQRVETGLYAMSATRGIYHWLVDRVPFFAWMMTEDAPDAAILLSDEAPSFERDTLELIGLDKKGIVAVGRALSVGKLLVSRVGFRGLVQWEQVSPVFEALSAEAKRVAVENSFTSPKRIYISRRDAQRRQLTNEAELEALLGERGYSCLTFAGMPLWKQIAMVSQADSIVAPHGAGLSHLMFLQKTCTVTEILPIKSDTYVLRFNYARLSIVRGLKYKCWVEPQPANEDSWSVNLKDFLQFFDTHVA